MYSISNNGEAMRALYQRDTVSIELTEFGYRVSRQIAGNRVRRYLRAGHAIVSKVVCAVLEIFDPGVIHVRVVQARYCIHLIVKGVLSAGVRRLKNEQCRFSSQLSMKTKNNNETPTAPRTEAHRGVFHSASHSSHGNCDVIEAKK